MLAWFEWSIGCESPGDTTLLVFLWFRQKNRARRTVLWAMIGRNQIRTSMSSTSLSPSLVCLSSRVSEMWAKCAHACQTEIQIFNDSHTFLFFDGVTDFSHPFGRV